MTHAGFTTPLDQENDYQRYVAAQEIPVLKTFYIDDIASVELGEWKRKNGRGCLIELEGTEGLNDSYICEIPPKGSLAPDRHLFEEFVYVVSGRGSTKVWNESGAEVTFEWQAGSVFSIPLNAWYQHFNASGTEPARYYAVTSAPLLLRLFHNMDFVLRNNFDFIDRFSADNADFSGAGVGYAGRVWDTKFIADVRKTDLLAWKERGAGGTNLNFEIADSSLCGHISEFPVGTYKKAHRHIGGAHVIILSGQGFSLLWAEGQPMTKVDWKPGSVIVPPDRWFHQHFNTGAEPARYMAFRWGGRKYPLFKEYKFDYPTRLGGDQIEYEDEDPQIARLFEGELDKSGVASRMAEVVPNARHEG
jgi:oxalate decarboxylase/phosphoglucose isomerase-like protein (cupin superfamily)